MSHERGPVRTSPQAHDVGELASRSTEELLGDLRQLVPRLDQEHLEHWRNRIERESADLVNAVIRKAQRARAEGRPIRNLAGWLNRCYLNAQRAREAGDGRKGISLPSEGAGSAETPSLFACPESLKNLHK